MATLLSRLQARLTRIEARIVELEAQYPKVLRAANYSVGFGTVSVNRQSFESIRKEYRELLDEKDRLDARIESLNGTDQNDGSFVAEFRPIE